jgi:alpha-mannosidase
MLLKFPATAARGLALTATAALALSTGAAPADTSTADADGTQLKAYLVSDAHLDTQWNWDIQTTIKDYVWNTINLNLGLLEQYPDYVFNFEGGVKYSWMKEYYPREFELMKKYVKEGRWHIAGASWDANDAIMPSVESALRNIMLGQQFYRNELGVESTDIFLPDCFGFGWTLPSIANHCGLIGFSSQKLGWRNNPFYGDKKYPFTIGLWRGIDGAEIMMTHGYSYNQRWDGSDLSENRSLIHNASESPLKQVYRYYGTGDTGGAPSQPSVQSVVKGLNGNGPVKIVSATSDQIYKDYQPYSAHPELPVFDGELLMDVHGTGCYTSQAAMKLYNRQNEQLGDAAERASVAAELLGLEAVPTGTLTTAWQRFIFHQFHDDLTGTSIPRAYEFSWNDELITLKQFADVLSHSVGVVADKLDTRTQGTPVVLFNPLDHTTTDVVEVRVPATKRPATVTVKDSEGRKVAAQVVDFDGSNAVVLVEATVPATGFAVYDVKVSGSGKAFTPLATTGFGNSIYNVNFDANGDITSLVDCREQRELVKEGKAIRLALFTENESFAWPAWEVIKKTIDAEPVSINGDVKISLVENGPLRYTVLVEKTYGESSFRQYIRMYDGALADRIDFYNDIDWHNTNSLLKAEFPLSVSNAEATYDLGLGAVRRGNNTLTAYEVPAQQWADLSDANYGVTVMNDCKYGWDKPDDNTLRLTLLHTPKTRGGYAYQDHQDQGHHTFTYTLTGHSGAVKSEVAKRAGYGLNQRIKAFTADKHAGSLGRSFSLASIDNDKVAMMALKKAEQGDEYVVRVYENSGTSAQTAHITFANRIVSAVEADGTEKTIGAASFSGNTLNVEVGKNGLKTFRVKFEKPAVADKATYSLPLNYDKRCFSLNNFGSDVDFESGYSYALELIPDTLVYNGVPFKMETKMMEDGHSCKGDTLALPAGNQYTKLYLLAAAATDGKDLTCTFNVGGKKQTVTVPSYSGFIGQWGHTGHTTGYMKDATVAYVGTHRHSSEGDHPYEYTYMYQIALDIPAKATSVILPDAPEAVIFSATLGNEPLEAQAASPLFRTNNVDNAANGDAATEAKVNLLTAESIMKWSGYVNDEEAPRYMVDGDETTKWCDTGTLPNYVDFDLGTSREVKAWRLVNAGIENGSMVTSSCYLQGRNSLDEEWQTLDSLRGNRRNVVERNFEKPATVRYIRLLVTQPCKSPNVNATRIYELAVY